MGQPTHTSRDSYKYDFSQTIDQVNQRTHVSDGSIYPAQRVTCESRIWRMYLVLHRNTEEDDDARHGLVFPTDDASPVGSCIPERRCDGMHFRRRLRLYALHHETAHLWRTDETKKHVGWLVGLLEPFCHRGGSFGTTKVPWLADGGPQGSLQPRN